MRKTNVRNKSRGFSLFEMAVVLVIAGLMVGITGKARMFLPDGGGSSGAASSCYAETKKQLAVIQSAMNAFVNKNQRFPIPAGRSLGTNDPKFGKETTLPADLANIDRLSNTNNLLFGALPFQALGLSEYYAADCWGNKFSYVVTEKMTTSSTSGGYPDSATVGGITVKSSSTVTIADAAATPSKGAGYAVISHGETATGAVKKNYSSAAHGWCTVATALDTENCDITNLTLIAAPFTNNGSTSAAAFFDDLVLLGGKLHSAPVYKIYAWAYNSAGQVGDGTTTNRLKPAYIALPASAKPASVYAGPMMSCAIDTTGNAYCWGHGGDGGGGALGNNTGAGTTALTPQAVVMPGSVKFTKMAIGNRHTCALADTGDVYCWGDNASGQRGDGVTGSAWNKPTNPVTKPGAVTRFTDVVAADNVNCALGDNGKAYCWGAGSWRQTGDNTTTSRSVPYLVTMPAGVNFTQLVAGYFTMCAVGDNKKYYCWGSNITRQFGNNAAGTGAPLLAYNASIEKARGGHALTCGIRTDNQTWCFGNYQGTGGPAPGVYPEVQSLPLGTTYFKDFAVGSDSRCGIASDDMVYCIGEGSAGQMGNNSASDSSSWVAANFGAGVDKVKQISGVGSHYITLVQMSSGS